MTQSRDLYVSPTGATRSSARQMLNKVPEVTVFFWVIKVLATTVGETAADYLNVNLGLGLSTTPSHFVAAGPPFVQIITVQSLLNFALYLSPTPGAELARTVISRRRPRRWISAGPSPAWVLITLRRGTEPYFIEGTVKRESELSSTRKRRSTNAPRSRILGGGTLPRVSISTALSLGVTTTNSLRQ